MNFVNPIMMIAASNNNASSGSCRPKLLSETNSSVEPGGHLVLPNVEVSENGERK